MSDELRKVIENAVPPAMEKWFPRWALYLVFWVVTALIAAAFLMTGLVYGALVVGGPLLLLAATRWQGLGKVHPGVLVFGAAMSLVPTFFLGRYQGSPETPSGMVLFGFLVFLLWVTAYPVVLDKLDHHPRDEDAVFRMLLVKSWIATIGMLVADNSLVAVLCLFALLVRRRATAAIAGIACLVAAVVSFEGGELTLTFDVIDIFAGVTAAWQWWAAVRNPLWER